MCQYFRYYLSCAWLVLSTTVLTVHIFQCNSISTTENNRHWMSLLKCLQTPNARYGRGNSYVLLKYISSLDQENYTGDQLLGLYISCPVSRSSTQEEWWILDLRSNFRTMKDTLRLGVKRLRKQCVHSVPLYCSDAPFCISMVVLPELLSLSFT